MMTVSDLITGSLNAGALSSTGFQATQLGRAVEIIKRMKKERATVFLSFTSNMVASGLRGLFADLCRRKFIDVIITAGGSLDHDLMRAYKQYQIGGFLMDDRELHKKGINRLGNILIGNECYVELEKRMKPIFEKLYAKSKITSPSEIAEEIGKSLRDRNSFLYWCSKNNIPVFCPGITDSAIGLQAYFFKQQRNDFAIDVTKDMQQLASVVLNAKKTGGIILGGGIAKHHTIGVNILRGGLDYAVYINTASPWDGSLSGALAEEAISWGKIGETARHVTVNCDATVAFPLVMSSLLRS